MKVGDKVLLARSDYIYEILEIRFCDPRQECSRRKTCSEKMVTLSLLEEAYCADPIIKRKKMILL